MRLLTAAGAGAGAAQQIGQWGNREISHLYTFYVWGTFGGATVTLEISFDGVEWFTVTGISITVRTVINAEFRARFVRAVVTGGAGQAIDAFLA